MRDSCTKQGIREGIVRPVRIPIFKMMLEASLEQFFRKHFILTEQKVDEITVELKKRG